MLACTAATPARVSARLPSDCFTRAVFSSPALTRCRASRDGLRLGGTQPRLGDLQRGTARERLGDERIELRIAVTAPPLIGRPGGGVEPRPGEGLLRGERARLQSGRGLPVTALDTADERCRQGCRANDVAGAHERAPCR